MKRIINIHLSKLKIFCRLKYIKKIRTQVPHCKKNMIKNIYPEYVKTVIEKISTIKKKNPYLPMKIATIEHTLHKDEEELELSYTSG